MNRAERVREMRREQDQINRTVLAEMAEQAEAEAAALAAGITALRLQRDRARSWPIEVEWRRDIDDVERLLTEAVARACAFRAARKALLAEAEVADGK